MPHDIKITCQNCGMQYDVERDHDAPEKAVSMSSNLCTNCINSVEGYYNEWYNYKEIDKGAEIDPNQLEMKFD